MTRRPLWLVWMLLMLGGWILFAVLVWAAWQLLAGALALVHIIEGGLNG